MTPLDSATNRTTSGFVFQDIDYQDTCKLSTKIITEARNHKFSTCIFGREDHPHILSIPRQLPCGHRACKACLEEKRLLSNNEFSCPNNDVCPDPPCAEKITPEACYNDKVAGREINDITVRCPHNTGEDQPNSCNWIGKLKDFKSVHLSQCPVGRVGYLIEENQYLKKQVEIFKSAPSDKQADAQNSEIDQLHKTVDEQRTTISLKDREITELQKTVKRLENENDDCQAKISDCQSEIAAYQLHFQDLSGDTGNTETTETKPKKAAAKPEPSGVAASQTPLKKRSVSPTRKGVDWKFNYVTADKHSDSIIMSTIFPVGRYDYRLLFKYNQYSSASLFLQVMGGDEDAEWPCKESLSLSLKAQNAGPKHDISHTLHLANAPILSRSRPGKSQSTANAAVGFAEFCSERYLTLPRGRMSPPEILYLDEQSRITLSVSPVAHGSSAPISPVYDVIPGSVGLYWPIREYSRKDGRHSLPSDSDAFSPKFYTSDDGYCFRLKLDTQHSSEAGSSYTGVKAVLLEGKNDKKVKWPMKGSLSITMVDRNPQSEEIRDITVSLPIAFDSPSTNSYHIGPGSKTSNEKRFYPRMSVLNEGGADLTKPVYKYNDTVLVTANFVPWL